LRKRRGGDIIERSEMGLQIASSDNIDRIDKSHKKSGQGDGDQEMPDGDAS